MAHRNGGKNEAAYNSEVQQRLREFRRLSDQLTEVTLAAMHQAEVQQPHKPLIEVPVMPYHECGLETPLSPTGLFDAGKEASPNDLQRLGRSRSLAVASLGSNTACRYCSTYNPFAGGDIWIRPSKNLLKKRGISQARSNNAGHWTTTLAASDGVDKRDLYFNEFMPPLDSANRKLLLRNYKAASPDYSRKSSSFGNLPKMTSQHTQTIFSSLARNESAVIKPRLGGTYGSLYSKRPGLKWQLSSMSKAKPFKKPCLDYGLRKTLSVTNAIVRMPIESSALPSKADSPAHTERLGVSVISTSALSDDRTHSEPHRPLTDVICNEAAHASEASSLLSWTTDANISTEKFPVQQLQKQELGATRSLQSSPEAFISKLNRPAGSEHIYEGTTEAKAEKEGDFARPSCDSYVQAGSHVDEVSGSQEVAPPAGKRNALLQTTEDFGNELKSNFSFPRILCEEDQTKEPGENVEAQVTDENGNKRSTDYWKDQFMTFFQPSDNKLAKKLFGTKMALNKERSRQRSQGKWIIHPCSNFRFYWDLMMLLLLIANLIILPVFISFFMEDIGLETICFNCVSDTIFLLDIIVNFRTGIIANKFADEIILNPRQIARHYVRTWFVLDFLSSVPLDYIFLSLSDDQTRAHYLGAGRALRILRLVKILSLLRLLRISRLVRYVSQWEEFINVANKFIGIVNLVLLMLLLGHWNACLQFLIPMLNEYPTDSWVMKCKLRNAGWFEQYTWALFKAMSHMLSIGYGRFPPTSASEAWITIISMMTGSTCYALFVGHAAALIQSFDCSKKMYREKFKQVEEYMAFRKLPRVLRQKIANYYEHRYQGKMFNEMVILDELSECLREEIVNHNCRALVAAVPFFTYADHQFVSDVVMKLKYEVFQPGDWIIKEGLIGTKMYFIQEGIVDIVDTDGRVATSLSDGSYFGEICLLTNARRVASVRAETYCNLYALDRLSFQEVLQNYPFMRRTLESVAAERLYQLGRDPLQVIRRKNIKEDLEIVKEIVSLARKNENDSASSESEGKQEAPGTESRRSQSGITAAMKTRMYRRRHSSDKSELREAASTEEVESDAIRVEETDCGETTSDQQVPAAGGGKDSRLLVPFAKRRRRGTHTALKHAIRRARKQLGEPPLASIGPEPNENPPLRRP